MNASPYLIKKLTTALKERLESPMWGHLPTLPTQKLASLLKSVFGKEDLAIDLLAADWKEQKEVESFAHLSFYSLYFCMSPLAPSFALYFPKEDLDKFLMFMTDPSEKRTVQNEIFLKPLTEFIFLKVLKAVDELAVFEDLKVKLTENPIVIEESYCADIAITLGSKKLIATLVFPKNFHHVITSHYASRPLMIEKIDSLLPVPITLRAGKVLLKTKEVKNLQVGEFVILDQSYYHPKTHQGTLILSLADQSLFYVKRKNHEIKILDVAEYDYQHQELREGFMDEKEEDLFPEEGPLDEELELEEEVGEEIEEALSPAELVPLQLHVEMAKITLPLKDILSLNKGSVLQLPIDAEQNVCLTLNSMPIARGELVSLGDIIGIKISEIA